MNIAAIIQARMGSTRLPAKVLKDIVGQPLLWHIVNRLKQCRQLNSIIVATSKNTQDDVLADYCRSQNIKYYRGDEEDVLDRYYQAAKLYQADVIVRITADCPLIDSAIVDLVIGAYLDLASNCQGASNVIKRTYPRGLDVEVFPFAVLKKARDSASDNYQREHVTSYIYEHPEYFKLFSVEHNKDLSLLRWTVDEEADLEFVREVYKKLYNTVEPFWLNDILQLLEKEPGLNEINKNVKQKSR